MTTAVVPFKPDRVALRIRKLEAAHENELQAWQLARDLLKNPVIMALGGVTAANMLSKADIVTGVQAVLLQGAFLTPAFLSGLTEATKTGISIAELVTIIKGL